MEPITIRLLNEIDPAAISQAFTQQGWNKPVQQYMKYLEEQSKGDRVTLVAEVEGDFAGYVNILWNSYYPAFQQLRIPEINDFNVLIKYRRRGIGTKLMDRAEELIKERSATAGIGVGLFSDYGPAQIMYVKRGYVPDGKGIHKNDRYPHWGDTVVIDDDIALFLTKKLG